MVQVLIGRLWFFVCDGAWCRPPLFHFSSSLFSSPLLSGRCMFYWIVFDGSMIKFGQFQECSSWRERVGSWGRLAWSEERGGWDWLLLHACVEWCMHVVGWLVSYGAFPIFQWSCLPAFLLTCTTWLSCLEGKGISREKAAGGTYARTLLFMLYAVRCCMIRRHYFTLFCPPVFDRPRKWKGNMNSIERDGVVIDCCWHSQLLLTAVPCCALRLAVRSI